MATIQWTAEETDTYGGEANYSWVNRVTFEMPEAASRRQIVTAAKHHLGYTGIKCDTEDYGDSYTLRPRGMGRIVFIN